MISISSMNFGDNVDNAVDRDMVTVTMTHDSPTIQQNYRIGIDKLPNDSHHNREY